MTHRASSACAAVAIGLAALAVATPSFGQSAPPPAPTLPSTPDILSLPQRKPARELGPDVAPSPIPARVSPTPPSSASGSASNSGAPPGSGSPSAAGPVAGSATAAPPAPGEDIRDIRGPKGMLPAWLIPALVAGALLLALVVYAVRRWQRRRNRPRPLLPFEISLQRLEEIRRLMDPSSAREFSIAVSDIVREYIEVQFRVTATHRTTEEFLRDLLESTNASLAAHRSLLAEFLNQCDLAKFAGVSLSRRILESLHASARSFVTESSKPPPAPPARDTPPPLVKESRDSIPTT